MRVTLKGSIETSHSDIGFVIAPNCRCPKLAVWRTYLKATPSNHLRKVRGYTCSRGVGPSRAQLGKKITSSLIGAQDRSVKTKRLKTAMQRRTRTARESRAKGVFRNVHVVSVMSFIFTFPSSSASASILASTTSGIAFSNTLTGALIALGGFIFLLALNEVIRHRDW